MIETGGKQYRVTPGDKIDAELLEAKPGDTVEIERVLLISDDKGHVTVGTPTVSGAKVLAKAVEEVRADKVIVFKYKPKVRYRKKTGHRQRYTKMLIEDIVHPKPAAKSTRKSPADKSEVKSRGPQKRRRQHPTGA